MKSVMIENYWLIFCKELMDNVEIKLFLFLHDWVVKIWCLWWVVFLYKESRSGSTSHNHGEKIWSGRFLFSRHVCGSFNSTEETYETGTNIIRKPPSAGFPGDTFCLAFVVTCNAGYRRSALYHHALQSIWMAKNGTWSRGNRARRRIIHVHEFILFRDKHTHVARYVRHIQGSYCHT